MMERDGIADLRIRENLTLEERAKRVAVDFSVQEIDPRTSRLHVEVSGTIDGYEFHDTHSPLLQTSNAVCTPCTRKDGDYFEATVQLRSAGRKLNEEELSSLRSTLDELQESMEPNPMFFVSKEGPVTGGWDLQLGSKSLARTWGRKLTRSFGGSVKESSTVVGVNEGVEVTRLTLSYRKPAYSIGDVVRFKKTLWVVDSWQKDGPILRKVERFERSGATWRDMESSSVVCARSEQSTVNVLNRDSSAAEFMDPSDYKVSTVALPYDDDGEAVELRIGFIDGGWVALPVSGKGGGK
jgi:nonsense-mediated mRNA decay protein 3